MNLTHKQFATLSTLATRDFERRLHDHIRARASDPALEVESFATRAIALGKQRGLLTEDEFAALVEVLLAVRSGELGPGIPDWLDAILLDRVPRRATRLRHCLSIERRVAAARTQHG